MTSNTNTAKYYLGRIVNSDYVTCFERNNYPEKYFVQYKTTQVNELGTINYYAIAKDRDDKNYANYIPVKQLIYIRKTSTFALMEIRSAKGGAGYPQALIFQKNFNASQAVDYIVALLEAEHPANTTLKSATQYTSRINAYNLIPTIVKLLAPSKRLEILERLHKVATNKINDSFIRPVRTKKGNYTTRDKFIDSFASNNLAFLGKYLANEIIQCNTENETHGLEKYFYEKAFQLDLTYSSIDGYESSVVATSDEAYSKIVDTLSKRKEDEYRYFDAPTDTWNTNQNTRRGTAINLAAFMARRAIRKGFANEEDYKIIEEYKKFCSIIHRTTKVFEDNFTVKYYDEDNLYITIPQSAEEIPIKEAKEKLKQLAEATTWKAMAYACYTQLILIGSLKKAAYYTRKRKQLAKGEQLSFTEKDLNPVSKRIRLLLIIPPILITLIACITVFVLFAYRFSNDMDFRNTVQLVPYKIITVIIGFGIVALFFVGIGNADGYPVYGGYYPGYWRHRRW